MFERYRPLLLTVMLVIIGGALYYLTNWTSCCAQDATIPVTATTTTTAMAPKPSIMKDTLYPRAKEIVDPTGFINIPSNFKIADNIGKRVILIDFWTYSCINCIRTQPYLNAWQEKYSDKGLLIVGVHTPEFEFEKKIENVQDAVTRESITYPVVLDSNYGTWRAYQNSYWPRKYLIDIDGYIMYDHIGEGGYEETEHMIQKALMERAERFGQAVDISSDIVNPADIQILDAMPRTPEMYFGSNRNAAYLGNGTASVDGVQTFSVPATPIIDHVYFNGTWNVTSEFITSQGKGASIVLPYRAKSVYMVASSPKGAHLRVYIDGKPVSYGGAMAGADISGDDLISIKEERLYKIIESTTYGTHTIELRVIDGSLDAFTFTFG